MPTPNQSSWHPSNLKGTIYERYSEEDDPFSTWMLINNTNDIGKHQNKVQYGP